MSGYRSRTSRGRAEPASIGETFGDIAKRAEDAGFASLWVMDHFFQIPGVGQPEQEMLEGYTALAFAAARTSRIKLGTMVTGVTYRQPGVLVKTATTLDVLSGGRAYFGVGAAWFEREHLGPRRAVPAVEGTVRAAGRIAPDRAPDVGRGRRPVRRPALPTGARRSVCRSRCRNRIRRS